MFKKKFGTAQNVDCEKWIVPIDIVKSDGNSVKYLLKDKELEIELENVTSWIKINNNFINWQLGMLHAVCIINICMY